MNEITSREKIKSENYTIIISLFISINIWTVVTQVVIVVELLLLMIYDSVLLYNTIPY